MKKYRTSKYNINIEELDVIRETASLVHIRISYGNGRTSERRDSKITTSSRVHDSWEDAKIFLLTITESEVNNLRVLLAKKIAELEAIDKLTNTDETP